MKQAFSLVELSIVLVILGLLTGGILAGQSLIRAAELRTVSTDIQRYRAAQYAFRDKYFALAGDMTNATSFWGKDNTYCSSDTGTPATNGTCNGNGDGAITNGVTASATAEPFQFWKQLALAGLIEGTYTGLAGPNSGMNAVGGTNTPASKIGAAATFNLRFNALGGPATQQFEGAPAGNYMHLGAAPTGNPDGDDPVMKPEEAWNLDTKMDDGKPGTGFMNAYKNSTRPNCTTNDVRATAEYRLGISTVGCNLLFSLQ